MAHLNYTRIGRRSPIVKAHRFNSSRFHIRISLFCRIFAKYLKSLRRRICRQGTGGSFPRTSSRKGLVSGKPHVGQQQVHISGSYCGHSNSFSTVDPIADCLEFIRMNSVYLGSST